MEKVIYLAQALPINQIDPRGLPIIPFGDLLTFVVRLFFIIAGLAALIYGLLGGLAWITSGGGKDEIQAARDKIQAAIVGIFILILFLSIIWTLENIVFQRNICFGLSCPVTIPQLKIAPLSGTTDSSVSSSIIGRNNKLTQAMSPVPTATPTLTPNPQMPQTGTSGQ